jgi:hypothetical protein
MNSETGNASPQFETVEYAPSDGKCVLCNQSIGSTHYRINGEQVCSACAEREKAAQRDSASNYSRSLAFGIGAAILGMIGYATFEIATGWIIGYVALAVGWLVGKAMLMGSKGIGGRKYQITAAVLTYAAVSLAALPVMFSQVAKEKKEPKQVQVQQAPQPADTAAESSATPATSGDTSNASAAATEAETTSPTTAPKEAKTSFGKAVGMLLLIGLASPFLELASPLHGLIGLFILFIGIQIAWKMTGRPKLVIDGPF